DALVEHRTGRAMAHGLVDDCLQELGQRVGSLQLAPRGDVGVAELGVPTLETLTAEDILLIVQRPQLPEQGRLLRCREKAGDVDEAFRCCLHLLAPSFCRALNNSSGAGPNLSSAKTHGGGGKVGVIPPG